MKLRNYLHTSTIVHIIYWLVSWLLLYLLTGVTFKSQIITILTFMALLISLGVYYIGFGLVILIQSVGLIGLLYNAVAHKVNPEQPPLSWPWQIVNIGINAALLVVSPYHELWTGWMSI